MNESSHAHPCVIITRPDHQAQPLADALRAASFEPVRFPALELIPMNVWQPGGVSITGHLAAVIFVSPNAVRFSLSCPYWQDPVVQSCQWWGVGAGTAQLARQHYPHQRIQYPHQGGSEFLLQSGVWENLRGRQVLIVRGREGRETLAQQLRQHGIDVIQHIVYRNVCPAYEPDEIQRVWNQAIAAVIITSAAIAVHLRMILHSSLSWRVAQTTGLVAISSRVLVAARESGLGQGKTVIAGSADPAALVNAVHQLSGRT